MANTAQRSALSMIADTPEEQAALQKVMASRKALEDALKSRENQLFDPVLLAIAQGMLSPTKTGSFGEALGNAAAMVGPAQAGEEKRAMEIAQIRSELAAQELGMAQTARGEREFRRLLGGQAPVQAGAGAPPAQAAITQGAPSAGAIPSESMAPQGARPLTEMDVARLAAMPGMEAKAKILGDMMKLERDRFAVGPQGIFDRDARRYLNIPIPGQTQSEFSTPYGTFKMTPYEYDQYKRAEEEGKGQDWIEKFRRPGGMAAPGAAPGRKTVSQSEAESAAAKEEAVAGAKSRGEQTAQVRAAGKAALGLLPIYDRMEVLIKAPGMDQVMGVLERGDVISALGSLVEEAVRVGTFSVGVPAVRKIVAQTGAPQDVIDRAAELGQLLAITQFEQRKGLGSGTSVSNFEQQMVNAMGPNMTDTLRSFGQKLNFMREKAKFESELASALRRSKMQYEDFEDTPEFAKLFGDYQRRVTNIVYPGQKPFKVVR